MEDKRAKGKVVIQTGWSEKAFLRVTEQQRSEEGEETVWVKVQTG